jgi:hypothetical protein
LLSSIRLRLLLRPGAFLLRGRAAAVLLVLRLTLRLCLLELLQLPLHEVAVVLRVGVVRLKGQRRFIRRDGVAVALDALWRVGRRLPHAIQRVAAIVIGALLEAQVATRERGLVIVRSVRELTGAIARRGLIVVVDGLLILRVCARAEAGDAHDREQRAGDRRSRLRANAPVIAQ